MLEHLPELAVGGVLIGGTVGISLLHGSNDGQKSLGLFFLCALGLLPGLIGINKDADELYKQAIAKAPETISQAEATLGAYPPLAELLEEAKPQANEAQHAYDAVVDGSETARQASRRAVVDLSRTVRTILNRADAFQVPSNHLTGLQELATATQETIFFVPFWVIALSASCLGFGTIVGYKRIVQTLGEKLGESPISPAHGVASQFTAVGCIGLATVTGLPVSTTHVLTSGVVGALNSSHQRLKFSMISSILVTWLTTLPGSILLAFVISYLLHLGVTT
jgi:inorganic phosphate transporter, PiT family